MFPQNGTQQNITNLPKLQRQTIDLNLTGRFTDKYHNQQKNPQNSDLKTKSLTKNINK